MAIIIIRTLIVYFALLLTMRLLGKRQLGEMELSEFVLAALIADLAAHPLQDIGIPLMNGLLPIIVLFCCEVLIAWWSIKSIRIRSLFFGKPSILIEKGKINQLELRKNRLTVDELMEQLRSQSCTDISSVEYAILETGGKLSLLLYPSKKPPTAELLGKNPESGGLPVIIVSDGRIIGANLTLMGYDRNWLEKQLKARGHESPDTVFLMTVNATGQIFFAPKEASK